MDTAALLAFLGTFMAQHRYAVISSTAENGAPQSALVGIATTPALEIIFDTVATSRKYQNLQARPSCSLVIGWSGEQTVQMEGIAEEPRGSDLKRYQDLYFAVWTDGPLRMKWPGIAYFVVHPRWIRYCDFDQRPPLIQEVTLHSSLA